MFEKMKLKNAIKTTKKQIAEVESKRIRSQGALVQAILEQKDPDDEDVEFFNKYTAEIDALREKLEELQQQPNG